jgi:hypothetical protein
LKSICLLAAHQGSVLDSLQNLTANVPLMILTNQEDYKGITNFPAVKKLNLYENHFSICYQTGTLTDIRLFDFLGKCK